MRSEKFYYTLSVILGIILLFTYIGIGIVVSDNVIISKPAYQELLQEEEILESIDSEIKEKIVNGGVLQSEISEFEIVSRNIMSQFHNYQNILFYKAVISEENNVATYYVVYRDIDEIYESYNAEIKSEVNDLCLCLKKEWNLWGYKDMVVLIDVSGEDTDFTYIMSENGKLSYDCNEPQIVHMEDEEEN